MHLGSGLAVAVAQIGSYSSKSTLSLGTSTCHWCGPKKRKKKKKKKKAKKENHTKNILLVKSSEL